MDRDQLELRLRYRRKGGRREGAGRKIKPYPRLRHLPREAFSARHPVHVTLKVRSGLPSLRTRRFVREIERSFALAKERPSFRLVHYSIQRDHAHLIIEAGGPEALGLGMNSVASRLARAVNRVFRRRGRVLEDRYHVRPLRTPREVRAALRYVLLNTRKHDRASGVEVDPASSGRWFDGWKGRVPVPDEPCPVARPRSWLLTHGWRRWGLLDPRDIPGRD